jgi:preprotein translocase subunit SecF
VRLLANKTINFVGYKKITWLISFICCVVSLISLFINGLNLSLEFMGGTQLETRFAQPTTIEYVENKLHATEFKSARVQRYGTTKDFLIRISNANFVDNADNKIANKVVAALSSKDNTAVLRQVEHVGSEVGEKLVEQGAIAVIIAIFATMLYIIIRFEYRLAVSAAITLCHNSIIVLGCFALTKYEFDLATLAAILAIIGYSLNDTIVIFDRIRENFRKYHRDSVRDIVNRSINQTLSRTIMTSLLTLLVVVSLLFAGGQSLFGFALALTIGIIIGTYASICIAGTVAMWMGLSRQDFLKTSG